MDSNPQTVDFEGDPSLEIQGLKIHSFDQAPVTRDGVIIGWLTLKELEKTVSIKSSTKLLSPEDLISNETSLNDTLQKLTKQQLFFLVGSEGIEGFVVTSDISRHVSRAHLYLLISGLEIIMTKIVTAEVFDKTSLFEKMKDDSKNAWTRAKNQGLDANPVEYLDLIGLSKVLVDLKKPLIHLQISEKDWNAYIKILGLIRNWIAHSNSEQIEKHPFRDIVEKAHMTENFIRKLNTY